VVDYTSTIALKSSNFAIEGNSEDSLNLSPVMRDTDNLAMALASGLECG
jgi:hypothetical protein